MRSTDEVYAIIGKNEIFCYCTGFGGINKLEHLINSVRGAIIPDEELVPVLRECLENRLRIMGDVDGTIERMRSKGVYTGREDDDHIKQILLKRESVQRCLDVLNEQGIDAYLAFLRSCTTPRSVDDSRAH